MKNVGHISVLGSGLIAGILIGVGSDNLLRNIGAAVHSSDVREAENRSQVLTSPLLECGELSQSVSDTTLATLHENIQNLVDTYTKKGDISYASVYFRDLNNGPWFGINESDEFFPASLLKLPLAMSFYSRAEDDPSILEKKVTYIPDSSTATQTQPFGPKHNIEREKNTRSKIF